tara:strand:- start:1147 stop:2259 length:1113 start_codon:yes stop_codon:yes gene_type:complete
MKVKFYKIGNEFERVKKPYLKKINTIFNTGNFILGNSNMKFEKKISKLLNVKYVCGVGNGSDALEIGLIAIGIKKGDEVITASNSWVSSLNAILNVGAKPVLVDVENDYNINCQEIKKAITKKTKAIMPVHLNGLPAKMNEIKEIAKKYKVKIIEDSAQAILSKYKGKYAGTIGDVGCFSMHPTKNLGVAGDGGFIVTNEKKIFDKIKIISNHGANNKGDLVMQGRNSRLDELQAEFILHKLKYLKEDTKKKKEVAATYEKQLKKYVIVPTNIINKSEIIHTYHRYVIRLKNKNERNLLKKYLEKYNIETKIHYPKPIHGYKCFSKYSFRKRLKNSEDQSSTILSLPINHFMSDREVNYVIKNIVNFFTR